VSGQNIEVKVLKLTSEAFKPFGSIISIPKIAPTVSTAILNYWDEIVRFEAEGYVEMGFLETKFRDFSFHEMERHVKSPETFIPLDGVSIFPLCPPSDLEDPNALPDPSKVIAFILDGSAAVHLKKGVWHWAPFPLGNKALFIVVLRGGTVKEDVDVKDLKAAKNIEFRLVL